MHFFFAKKKKKKKNQCHHSLGYVNKKYVLSNKSLLFQKYICNLYVVAKNSSWMSAWTEAIHKSSKRDIDLKKKIKKNIYKNLAYYKTFIS